MQQCCFLQNPYSMFDLPFPFYISSTKAYRGGWINPAQLTPFYIFLNGTN